jgi:allophanate hydrolase
MNTHAIDMSIAHLKQAYAEGTLTPAQLINDIRERAEQEADFNCWIYRLSESELQPYLDALTHLDPAKCALWGIPFAIKDNIDLAGVPTTAGCDEFAYIPDQSAFVVEKLIAQGAIPIGKTHMDQFATGLNGTRSPSGPCKNSFDTEFISGGSSSGSAVVLARGHVSFSLGTDTAGSGRVPACFNNLVGLKPSRGLLSTSGVVPACRSLDCVSIFALNTDDANTVLAAAEGLDTYDSFSQVNPYSNQPRHYGHWDGALQVGVIAEEDLTFFGDTGYEKAYFTILNQLQEAGVHLKEIDFSDFVAAAALLYEGPWVAERFLAIESFIESQLESVFSVVRQIIEKGKSLTATQLFSSQYALQALKKRCDALLAEVDCLLTPTAGRLFRIADVLADPIGVNTQLGYYTNFMNLLDLAAVSVPTCFTEQGLPFGVTLVGNRFTDRKLLSMANRIQQSLSSNSSLTMGASDITLPALANQSVRAQNSVDVLVCGAHLSGLPLNWQLTERGGTLKEKGMTAPCYRMYSLAGGPPFRPGLIKDQVYGISIEIEVWTLPMNEFGSFVAGIPEPLGIGKVELADGRRVCGFICELYGIEDAEEITTFGSWRNYLSH